MTSGALYPLEINLGPLAPHHLSEVIVGIVVAGLIWFCFAKFISPNFDAMYQERARLIEGGIELAEKAQSEAEEMRKKYEEQLATADAEASSVREQARAEAASERTRMRAETQAEKDRLLEQTRNAIAAERDTVENQIRTEMGGVATALASKIVGESLEDDERAKRTVERFLAELASVPAQRA
ncbi:MAG: F0F1 ATP synthase subunit B [Propionibacteriaceae bacterium]|jgi:F-type H+-transporting ATPase subunit b|nr:F0F1 ATP synthase subunit B [Propionibacteriaceae bacterium]